MNAPVVPVVLPLLTGAMLAAVGRRRLRWTISLASAALTLAASVRLVGAVREAGIHVVPLGSWPPPFGIPFVADMLAALMCAIASFVALVTLLFVAAEPDPRRERFLHAGWHLLLAGMNGAFLTGDLFNLYVFFEIMLLASYFLLTLGNTRAQAREAFTYVAMNLTASAFFLIAVALLYSATGTLNMADLARRLPEAPPATARAGLALLATAFGVKAAVFPLYFWLPHAYAIPPGGVAAYFGGMLTKVGVYALFRLFTTIQPLGGADPLLLVVGGFTMTLGVLGALAQEEIRRILSFHIVSQIGYMVMALGLQTPLALAAGIFFVLHNIGAKTSLLLVGAAVERAYGSGKLEAVGGLAGRHPALGILFVVAALSLAGVPPFSGFLGKFALVRAGLEADQALVTAVAIAVSLLTLLSMVKIFVNVFWGAPVAPRRPVRFPTLAPVAAIAALSVAWGLGGQSLFDLTEIAARHLLDPAEYGGAVLGR
ncbi:MAG: proton-conducting transporter membrane subunit [Armatimonadota bacterium]|nr:proton-conducting transporter membrane subunit [Armatimonadota bacterium]MDR5696595.1 proton-conducting transporter membrane subunit [Armatimonadota bacterium]